MTEEQKRASLARNPISGIGAVLALVALMNTIFLIYVDARQAHSSPYLGILAWIVAPAILSFGLFLFLLGVGLKWRRRRRHLPEAADYPRIDLNVRRTRILVAGSLVGIICFVTVSVIGSYQAFHYTESDAFCGTTCHSVMHPEYTAYKASPHAKVGCVGCHVGPGATWYVKSKLSGSYQLYSVVAKKYPKPIATPVESLRPAQETCEQCHWPEKFWGAQLKAFNHYAYDEESTPQQVQMLIKTGGGNPASGITSGIHWHMNIANEVTYIAEDRQRQKIPWVRIKDSSGRVTEYLAEDSKLTPAEIAAAPKRTMDCVDCHNRPSHIYVPPDRAVDRALFAGTIDRTLPSAKQRAVEVLTKDYASTKDALAAIDRDFRAFFASDASKKASVDRSVKTLQEIFSTTRFPEMRVDWRTHPDNVGHLYSMGCFRCHDDLHVAKDGKRITKECSVCHTVLDGASQTAEFKHPVDLGDIRSFNCSDCHSGGGMSQ
jgi:hypothetical protein